MNLFADESVDKQIVERSRQEGHDVLYVAEIEPSLSDDMVLSRAPQVSSIFLAFCGLGNRFFA
jgi:hypothetical protein